MLRKLHLLRIASRNFSPTSPSTSTTALTFIDFSLSDEILKTAQAQIDRHSHQFIVDLYDDLQKTGEIRQKIYSIRGDLRKCFPSSEVRLVPIGSAANLLLNRQSDLDLVFLPATGENEWKQFMKKFEHNIAFRSDYMKKTRDSIRSKNIGFCLPPFLHAKIPLVRLESKRGLQVDIQFGNIGPIRSSLFVRTCVEFDERVALLIHWLTRQFRDFGILSSPKGKFSRYHVNVLVIHFLQAIPYPILPDIMRIAPFLSTQNDWNNAVKVLTKQGSLYVPGCSSEKPNEQNVGGLAVQLVDYFSQIDFVKNAIDTRGNVFNRASPDAYSFELVDEYFEHSTCRVQDAPRLLTNFFADLKAKLQNGQFEELFHYDI